jgi:hypothetical protein
VGASSPGGKYFGWNGKVLTARLQIGGRPWQWPLKGIDEEKAEALMEPVRVAREHLHQAAVEELNCELGTHAAEAAAAARLGARARLARAIITARGPRKLAEFVLKGPQEEVGTAVPQPVVIRRAERRAIKQFALENCVQRYIELIQAHPDGAPEPRSVLEKKMMKDFDVRRDDARKARAEAIRRNRRSLPRNSKWDQPGAPGK